MRPAFWASSAQLRRKKSCGVGWSAGMNRLKVEPLIYANRILGYPPWALLSAISYGQAWLGDPEKLKRLRPLCLSDFCRTDVDNITRSWNHDIGIGLSSNQNSRYLISVAQYQLNSIEALKQKLLQFPQGTAFVWHKSTNLDDDPGEPQTFLQVKSYLEDHGMKLEREPQQSQ